MKVFLSWSGDDSKKIAIIFRDWLPSVIQEVEPYVSSEDIDKGTRWSSDIANELSESSFGILCVTPENINAPWLNFEAGALSKAINKSYVSPFLFGMKRAEVKGPILQFQSTIFDKDDIWKLVMTINLACGQSALEETRLIKVFQKWWPDLESSLNEIDLKVSEKSKYFELERSSVINDSSQEMLEEILELTRSQQKKLNEPHSLLPQEYLEKISRRSVNFEHPAIRDILFYIDKIETILEKYQDRLDIPIEDLKSLYLNVREPADFVSNKIRNNDGKTTDLLFK